LTIEGMSSWFLFLCCEVKQSEVNGASSERRRSSTSSVPPFVALRCTSLPETNVLLVLRKVRKDPELNGSRSRVVAKLKQICITSKLPKQEVILWQWAVTRS
jgi:hypothetical protein